MTTSQPQAGVGVRVTAVDARRTATDWVTTIGAALPGFAGAWLAGSVAWLPGEAVVPAWSDVDVMVAIRDELPPKIGKLVHAGILLEISFIAAADISVAALNANYRVGCSFVQGVVLADPSGELGRVQAALRATFRSRVDTLDRIRQAREATVAGVLPATVPDERSLAWQVMWVFPAGLPTHLVLLGAGQNPTVRRRYEMAQPLFAQAGRTDLYEALLAATGYHAFTQADVMAHWHATQRLFDRTALHSARATPFFASDISLVARPIAIDGTRDSINRGFHREALFWLVATQARCLAVLEEVAPHLIEPTTRAAFQALVEEIGIATTADRATRARRLLGLLPAIEAFSVGLIAA